MTDAVAASQAEKDRRPRSRWVSAATARGRWGIVVLALLVGAAWGAPAQAEIGHNGHGQALSFQPVRGAAAAGVSRAVRRAAASQTSGATPPAGCTSSPCLSYTVGGAPVMHNPTLTPIFWQATGAPAYPTTPSDYVTTIDRFFTDLAADSGTSQNFYSVLTQYYDTVGGTIDPISYSVTAGTPLTDTDAYPTDTAGKCTSPVSASRPCVTDTGLQNELTAFISAHHLPTGLGHEYVVYFPPGVDSCFDNSATQCSGRQFCGYHSYLVGTSTPYANEPDNGDPAMNGSCGLGWVSRDSAMATLNTTSHEVSESITDPELDAWIDPSTGNEVGDICAWSFAQNDPAGQAADVPPSGTNTTVNGDHYIFQAEWDNANDVCSLMAQPTASFSDSSGGVAVPAQTSVSFDASGTHVPSGRTVTSYRWAFGDGSTGSGATASHAYSPAAGGGTQVYQAVLTVTDSAGQTGSSTHSISVTPPASGSPSAAFNSPTAPVAGSPSVFDGSASNEPGGTITGYSWSFGDGGSASGATPQHTFAQSGVYDVTLTVSDASGQTGQVSHLVSVAAPAPSGPAGGSGTTSIGGGPGASGGGGTMLIPVSLTTLPSKAASPGTTPLTPGEATLLRLRKAAAAKRAAAHHAAKKKKRPARPRSRSRRGA